MHYYRQLEVLVDTLKSIDEKLDKLNEIESRLENIEFYVNEDYMRKREG